MVAERVSRDGVTLYDLLNPLHDGDSAELDVPLHHAIDADGSEQHQGWRQQPESSRDALVVGPGLQEGRVSPGVPEGELGPELVITEVADMAVIEIEHVVPGCALAPRLPRTGAQRDNRAPRPVDSLHFTNGVDSALEQYAGPVVGHRCEVIVGTSVDERGVCRGASRIAVYAGRA